MLDKILANALEGFTIIEDDSGAVGKILANQMGSYAEAAGKRVGHYSFEREAADFGEGAADWRKPSDESPASEIFSSGGGQLGAQILGKTQRRVARGKADYDLIVLDGLATYLYGKAVREVVDAVQRLVSQTRQKSFIVSLERGILGERTASYVKEQADSVIIVRSEISADRVLRTLYIQKLRGTYPSDRLIKFTLDENGLQVDTREFLG